MDRRSGTRARLGRALLLGLGLGALAAGAARPAGARRDGDATETGCPASQIEAGSYSCYLLPPSATGALGQNADVASYVLTPAAEAPDGRMLVLHLNGSGGHPSGQIADPTLNFYLAAATLGYHVIGLSYASDDTVASLCGKNDGCYFPSRETLILGAYQPGAAPQLAGILESEGIADRLLLALEYLAQTHPGEGWDAFFSDADPGAAPEERIRWNRIVVSGHSQGGGHAAAIGKVFPVARVIQLSATCDEVGGRPASWLASAGRTDPTFYWGLGSRTTFTGGVPTGGDTLCPTHALSWQSEEMPVEHQNDAAATCGQAGDTHGVTISCAQNYANWQTMLAPAPCAAGRGERCVSPQAPQSPAPVRGRR